MNKVILLGRLANDPDVRFTQSGKQVTSFKLAVNRPKNKDGESQADFIPIVLWGKTAEVAGNYLAKGHRLLVEGRLQTRNYEADDGTKRYVTEVIGSSIEFIEKKEQSQPSQAEAMGQACEEEIPF